MQSGAFVAAQPAAEAVQEQVSNEQEPVIEEPQIQQSTDPVVQQTQPDETPVGFWADLVSAVRQEMKPPISGFFSATPNSPVIGELHGDRVVLCCANAFTLEMINKPEILALVARKASAILKRTVSATAQDRSAKPMTGSGMDRLMDFGRAHSDIVKIKEN